MRELYGNRKTTIRNLDGKFAICIGNGADVCPWYIDVYIFQRAIVVLLLHDAAHCNRLLCHQRLETEAHYKEDIEYPFHGSIVFEV